MDIILFYVAFIGVTAAMISYVGYAITRRSLMAQWAFRAVLLSVAALAVSLALRTYHGHLLPDHEWYLPWSNWFESLTFFSLVILIEYVIVQKTLHVPLLGALVTPFVWSAMLTAVHSPVGLKIPDVPAALQSVWMSVHVPVMFISYAAFAIAFAIGLAYLIQEWQIK
jgi:ABC-type transport system involved in cytochrome c biogenesis permease subunit